MMEIFLLLTDGDVTGRGCSTTDRICVGEHTVQSRHLRKGSRAVTVYSSDLFHTDGFQSSLGCEEKARVGHLYRGRDCENTLVEDTFQRNCYCRHCALRHDILNIIV